MKKWFFLLLFLLIPNNLYAQNLVYPIQEMSKVDCRFQDFDTLSNDCKMSLPILKTSDYSKNKNDYNLFRRVYTILWWSTYNYWWDVGNWWHQWVDIATAKKTPVYAMTDWKVVYAEFNNWGWWNVIKIEHTVNWKKIYSNYAHLHKILVKVWDIVKTNQKIWEVWSTWNSTWNHLHFQIDLAVSWRGPWYWPNCVEKNYDKIVNSNICFASLNNNTIDPLLFLETNWAVIKWWWNIEKPNQENISQDWLLSREEILKREIEEFLRYYQVDVKILNVGWNIELWKSWTFRISVTDKRTKKPFNWSFPWDMNFKYDTKRLSIFPTWILQIDNWFRDFLVTPKISWKASISIYIWETFFKTLNFASFDPKKAIIPKKTIFSINTNNVISEVKKWVFYFKDWAWVNIIWFNFSWDYTLKSKDNSVKFCIKKVPNRNLLNYTFNKDCSEEQLKNEVKFTSKEAFLWLILINYKLTKNWFNEILILNSKNEVVSSKQLNGILPKDLLVSTPYYQDIVDISQKWWVTWINNWYFLPTNDLNREDWINLIKNYLNDKAKNCLSNDCKNIYLSKVVELLKENNDKYNYFTRIEFFELISKYIELDKYSWNDFMDFRDLPANRKTLSKNILKSKTWDDYFWKTRYFQPNKNISRSESVFIVNNLVN